MNRYTCAHIFRDERYINISRLIFLTVEFNLTHYRHKRTAREVSRLLKVKQSPHFYFVTLLANGGEVGVGGSVITVANLNPLRRRATAHNSQ